MKYLIIGAGGTGGSIAASMTEAGLDVSVIARGEHLNAIKKSGIPILNIKQIVFECLFLLVSRFASHFKA